MATTGLLGVDLSNNNPNLNMSLAKAQGVLFVVAKASQGWPGGPGGWIDWTFVDISVRAKAAGLIPGGYHWPLRGNGALQAQQFVGALKQAGGPEGFLCAIDLERNDWNTTLNVDPQTVDDFLAEWDLLTGHHPILLYGAPWYHDGYMHAGARWPTRPLWVACYTGVAPEPIGQAAQSVTPGYMPPFGGWTNYAIRQFTSNAIVAGAVVDANVTYLSAAQLTALTHAPISGEFVMDAQATAAFAALNKRFDTLGNNVTTLVEGVPAGQPNPFGLVGMRDVVARLAAIEKKLGITP